MPDRRKRTVAAAVGGDASGLGGEAGAAWGADLHPPLGVVASHRTHVTLVAGSVQETARGGAVDWIKTATRAVNDVAR